MGFFCHLVPDLHQCKFTEVNTIPQEPHWVILHVSSCWNQISPCCKGLVLVQIPQMTDLGRADTSVPLCLRLRAEISLHVWGLQLSSGHWVLEKAEQCSWLRRKSLERPFFSFWVVCVNVCACVWGWKVRLFSEYVVEGRNYQENNKEKRLCKTSTLQV